MTNRPTLEKLKNLKNLPSLEKLKKLKKPQVKASYASITIAFGIFIFVILLSAIGLAVALLFFLVGIGAMPEDVLQATPIILFMAGISLVLGAILAFTSTRIPLKPFTNLINQMNRLAAGDFKARLHFGGIFASHPAFVNVADSFNKMAAELESTEMLRSDFINNFSHEFKTPIVSIAGFAKLLSHADLDEEQRRLYLHSIEEESTRLSVMATNVLKLTRIENQTELAVVGEYNLSEQIRSAVLLLESKWEEKELELELEFEEYPIEADEELLKEVWINLVDNAVKFTPHGGSVVLEIAEREDSYSVTISNTGETIPPEKLDKIFNRFYQADESHAGKGNGIGLAIVERVVFLHSGLVEVESADGWTTFRVTLPKKQ